MNRLILNSVFQSLIGLWLFLSPFIFGYGNLSHQPAVNNMLFGGFAVILGVVTSVYVWLRSEEYCRNEVLPTVRYLRNMRGKRATDWAEEEKKAA
jgi:hypothetical protein